MSTAKSKTYHSKLSAKHRTVLPRAVCERLRILPGDRLRYLVDDGGVRIEKAASAAADCSFTAFSEWSSEADDQAFADL
ncbi:MAG: AbrB/MazE/SpoVT family DNA-binding domain-containing protein [Roseiarcus sp.]|jgi:bifunctional DNA-binding transcriptional regulator/antitoxin component of YhaV-PrlF toxin-antitoxin module|uniref:AbrB/MazE/SpoVT family DNA-binding domain-containing protein n=1 Tax=Roseiarcus sp. TaxID=1969460 RepID=UPI003C208271